MSYQKIWMRTKNGVKSYEVLEETETEYKIVSTWMEQTYHIPKNLCYDTKEEVHYATFKRRLLEMKTTEERQKFLGGQRSKVNRRRRDRFKKEFPEELV